MPGDDGSKEQAWVPWSEEWDGTLDAFKRRQFEDRLQHWKRESEQAQAQNEELKAILYRGKLTGAIQSVDLLTNNPEYTSFLRRTYLDPQ